MLSWVFSTGVFMPLMGQLVAIYETVMCSHVLPDMYSYLSTVLPVHRADRVVGRQTRGVREGDEGNGCGEVGRSRRQSDWKDDCPRQDRRLRPARLDSPTISPVATRVKHSSK